MTMMIFRDRPDWMSDAACRGCDPAWFYPDVRAPGSDEKAKAVCATCPVRERCLETAIDNRERFGVFGGLTASERRDMIGVRCLTPERPISHGTSGGYAAHLRRGEPACRRCNEAHNAYKAEWQAS